MTIEVYTQDGSAAGALSVTVKGSRTLFEYAGPPGGVSRLVLINGGAALSLGIPAPEGDGLRLRRTMTRLELGGFAPEGAAGVLTAPDADLSALAAAERAPEAEPAGAQPALSPADTPAPAPPPGPAPEPRPSEPEPPKELEPPEMPEEPETQEMPEKSETQEMPEKPEEAEDGPGLRLVPAPEKGWFLEPDPGRHISDPELRQAADRAGEAWVRFEGADTLLAFPWTPSEPFPMIPIFRLGAASTMAGRGFIVFRLRDGAAI